MSTAAELLATLLRHPAGLTLAELLAFHPALARRTAQRVVQQLISTGRLAAHGAGRARRYFAGMEESEPTWCVAEPVAPYTQRFPEGVPLSADSRDVLAYVGQAPAARRPVGYQAAFLADYEPNRTWYLPEPLRRQLHRLGRTVQTGAPAGTHGRAILGRLLIDLSWASSHLEGNTYSRLDTLELLEHGRAATGKAVHETQMILNHKAAIELLVENIGNVGVDRFTLLNLHAALAENLLPEPADEGRIRRHAVGIAHSAYRPLSTPQLLEQEFTCLLAKAAAIADPFEQSFFLMVHLPYLQPFADVNKRTARLAANLPLFKANLCPLTFLDVPVAAYTYAMLGVYEMTRVELLRDVYLWAYERSAQEYLLVRQELAEPEPMRLVWRQFLKQAVHAVVMLPEREPLDVIRELVDVGVPPPDRANVHALVVEELRRLHEGVLARYGLRPSHLTAWRKGKGG